MCKGTRSHRLYAFSAQILTLLFSLLLTAVAVQTQAGTFDMFKKRDIEMCSETEGRITLNGEPVVGIEVLRELFYPDPEHQHADSTITDSDGRFYFPKVAISSRKPRIYTGVLGTEQLIGVKHEGEMYYLWRAFLQGDSVHPEYRNKLTSLECDLASEEVYFTFSNPANHDSPFEASSICRWDNDYILIRPVKLQEEDEEFLNNIPPYEWK